MDDLTRLEKDGLQRQLTEVAARAHEAFSFVDGAFATLDHLAAERPALMRPDMKADREAIQRQVASLRRRFDAARNAENVSSIVEATRLTSGAGKRLNELIAIFGPMTLSDRGVHPALAEGARLFFAGEYQQVVSVLNPSEGLAADTPLQLHVHLFRAAALHALFVRSREVDASLRAQALAEVEACRQIIPPLSPILGPSRRPSSASSTTGARPKARAPQSLPRNSSCRALRQGRGTGGKLGRGRAMILTLEITGPQAEKLGAIRRKVFNATGGPSAACLTITGPCRIPIFRAGMR